MDKLPTLAGIATTIGRISGMTYMRGIWKEKLLQGLQWEVDRKHSASAEEIRRYGGRPTWLAPTWSWASVPEPISWFYDDKYKSGTAVSIRSAFMKFTVSLQTSM